MQATPQRIVEEARVLLLDVGDHLLQAYEIGCPHVRLWADLTLALVGWDRVDLIQALDEHTADATHDA